VYAYEDVYVNACMHAYEDVNACICQCMFMSMHAYVNACMHVFMYACVCVYTFVCMHAYFGFEGFHTVSVSESGVVLTVRKIMHACMYVFMYMNIHVLVYVCVYVYKYSCADTYAHAHKQWGVGALGQLGHGNNERQLCKCPPEKCVCACARVCVCVCVCLDMEVTRDNYVSADPIFARGMCVCMCMCMYVYVWCVCVYIYTYIHIYIYIYIYIYIFTHTHIHIYTHTDSCTATRTHIHIHTHIHTVPRRITGLPPAAMVSCGGGHTAVVTRDGQLWVFGANAEGQLGVKLNSTRVPVPVDAFKNRRVMHVSCGGSITTVIVAPE
jgi:hypothetical protein